MSTQLPMKAALTVAMAMSLYQYNTPAVRRAQALYDHFDGDCAELADLVYLVDDKHWATAMAAPTAAVYVAHAVARYGQEASVRVDVNLGAYRGIRAGREHEI